MTEVLFPRPPATWSEIDRAYVGDEHRFLVEMADRVSERRQTANSFYLSINSAIVGGAALLGDTADKLGLMAISGAGILISLLWIQSIMSYKALNEAKFKVIIEIEKTLPVAPFAAEWKILAPEGGRKRTYRPFHKVESLVPWVFVILHTFQFFRAAPWELIHLA